MIKKTFNMGCDMPYGRIVTFAPLRSLAFGSIGANYAAIGGSTNDQTRLFTVTNMTDQDVLVSLNGIDDNLYVPTGVAKVFDLCSNRVQDDGFFLRKETTFYVKHAGVAPTTGSVYLEIVYADGGF